MSKKPANFPIEDCKRNVLSQPYLRLAQIGYDVNFGNPDQKYLLSYAMDWDQTPEGEQFWEDVNDVKLPNLPQCSIDALNADGYQWCRLPIPEGMMYVQPCDRVGNKAKGFVCLCKDGTGIWSEPALGYLCSTWNNEYDYAIPIIPAKVPKKPARKKSTREHLGYKINGVVYKKDLIGNRDIKAHKEHIEQRIQEFNEAKQKMAKAKRELVTYNREDAKGWK